MEISNENLLNYINAKEKEIKILSKKHLNNINIHRLKYFTIKNHIDNFINENNEYYNRFIVMPGLRGVGKTTILYQVYNYLINNNIDYKNIIYLDIFDLKSTYDTSIKEIFEIYLKEKHETTIANLNNKIFLLVDEAQLDKNWAKIGKLIFDKTFNVFMIFTGSSALELEMNTDATRRITKEQIFPCNFQEYLNLKHNINLSKNNFKELLFKYNINTINEIINCEKIIDKDLFNLDNDLEIELKKFLHSQGFPFALNIKEEYIHQTTNEIIKKIVHNDLIQFKKFNKVNDNEILRIITYLATKKPGTASNIKLSQITNLNVKTINNILTTLKQTQLIFSIPAYGTSGKILKKPLQHLFLTPSIKTALNYKIGRYNLNHIKCYATLAENLVASILYKLTEETMFSTGLFYDSNKKGVDFIFKTTDRTIPIEVGVGKKTKSQLTKAITNYNADFGILVSNRTERIKKEKNIIYFPLSKFALI